MSEREEEERHLASADQQIAQAEERIRLLQQRLKQRQAEGDVTETRKALLSKKLDSLDLVKIHRERILARLAELNTFP